MNYGNRNVHLPYRVIYINDGREIYLKAKDQPLFVSESLILCQICKAHSICHTSESIVFVQCTKCHNWFHSQCLQFSYSLLTKSTPSIYSDGLWYCTKCFVTCYLFSINSSILYEFPIMKNKKTVEREFYLHSMELEHIEKENKLVYLVLYNTYKCELTEIPQNSVIQINTNIREVYIYIIYLLFINYSK